MADQLHKYTVVTPHGDVNLTTPHHHSKFESHEAFLRAHQATITTALGLSTLALTGIGLYLSHGRGGAKLR
jgi:hypothetical protein